MPFALALNALSLAVTDLTWQFFGRRRPSAPQPVRDLSRVSVVIPSRNARDLLGKYLPSIIEAARFHPENEVIVVDNASHDGTAEMVRDRFPEVRLLVMSTNLGFGGGHNAGGAPPRHDNVGMENKDTRPEAGYITRLAV